MADRRWSVKIEWQKVFAIGPGIMVLLLLTSVGSIMGGVRTRRLEAQLAEQTETIEQTETVEEAPITPSRDGLDALRAEVERSNAEVDLLMAELQQLVEEITVDLEEMTGEMIGAAR